MVTRADVDGFTAEKTLAIVGVSRGGKKFGNTNCILMFTTPSAFVHRAHRWVWQMIGRVPA